VIKATTHSYGAYLAFLLRCTRAYGLLSLSQFPQISHSSFHDAVSSD
jgi:hypothetical protein